MYWHPSRELKMFCPPMWTTFSRPFSGKSGLRSMLYLRSWLNMHNECDSATSLNFNIGALVTFTGEAYKILLR